MLAGPLCTQALGDMGADIIKVEPVEIGDDTRRWPPFRGETGAIFLSANRNKRSLAVDLKTPEGRAIVHALAAKADIVIESYGAGVAERLGIDDATLRALNPRMIYCSISGFGRTGPLSHALGYDVILQAFGGIMGITGHEGGEPIRSPFSPIDQTTGLHAVTGILAALIQRSQTEQGSSFEVSLFETAMAFLAYTFQVYWEKGVLPDKCGSGHESLCPYQAFLAADKPILVGIANDNLWRRFCQAVDRQDLLADPRFQTNPDRVAHRAETVAIVQDIIAHPALRRMDRAPHQTSKSPAPPSTPSPKSSTTPTPPPAASSWTTSTPPSAPSKPSPNLSSSPRRPPHPRRTTPPARPTHNRHPRRTRLPRPPTSTASPPQESS